MSATDIELVPGHYFNAVALEQGCILALTVGVNGVEVEIQREDQPIQNFELTLDFETVKVLAYFLQGVKEIV